MINEIKFQVKGRPPRKSGAQSCWSVNSKEWALIYKLRECVFEAKKLAGFDDYFRSNTKITITIHAPSLTKKDEHTHIGDLDTFVAGIFEAIQPAPQNETLVIDEKLKNHLDFGSKIPLLVEDDSYITEVNAKKIKNDDTFYEIEIENNI
jgi:hypothetical protein